MSVILGKLEPMLIKPGDMLTNLWASDDNPTRSGKFVRFKTNRQVTRYRRGPITGTTEHFTYLVVMDTPAGMVSIHNDSQGKWKIQKQP
jgi:hypothetical protein